MTTATTTEQLAAAVKHAVGALLATPAFAESVRAGLTAVPAKGATAGTAAPAAALAPETLAKVSAMVGFPVAAELAKAALAEGADEPVGRYLAARGLRLDDPTDALPADLRKLFGSVNPATGARVALDAQLARGPGQRLAGLARRLEHEAAREARAEGRREDPGTLAKAAGAMATSIIDVSKAIPPIRTTPWTAHRDGYVDRREELRKLRDVQLELGNREGAALTNKELAAEEIKATQRGIPAMWWPTGTPVAPEAQP
jgi:hypothetical protein